MQAVVGVDSSTQSTKVELRAVEDGRVLWSGTSPHPPTTPPRSEQDPTDWWAALKPLLLEVFDRRHGRSEDGISVAGISVAAQQHGMVALDDEGDPVWPAKLWNDTEAAPDAAELVSGHGGAAVWARACGSVPGPAFTVAKLAWLRRCHPAAHHRVRTVLLPHDWLTWRLTGSFVTDRGDASGTGYFSPASGAWRPDLLASVGLDPSVLPRLSEPFEAVGEYGGAVVGCGTGDNMAAALGIGLRPGDVAISVGTSGTVFTVADQPVADPTGAVAGFADATGRFLPLVCALNATKVTDAVARLLDVDRTAFDQLALRSAPGAGGTVLVPYFDGERTPNRPDATGAILGLRSDVSREQLARAAVEGVVCGLLEGLDALEHAGVETRRGRLLLLGGGARSAAYRQVLADLSGRPVTVTEHAEHVAAGACLQAAAVTTGSAVDTLAEAWGVGRGMVVDPNRAIDAGAVRDAFRQASTRLFDT